MARGSLRKRAKGTWTLILPLGIDPDTGKRKQRWVTFEGNKEDAGKELTRLMAEIDAGGAPPLDPKTFREGLDYWLENAVAPTLAPSTVRNYRNAVERHIGPYFGRKLKLRDVGPVQVEAYFDRKRSEDPPLGEGTLALHHSALSAFYRWAIRKNLASRNPAAAIDRKPRRGRPERIECWDREEARAFKAHLKTKDTQTEALFSFLLECGVRRGEALGLRWSSVDLETRRVRIVEQLTRSDPVSPEFVPPKGGRVRVFSISGGLAALLRRHRLEQRELRLRNGKWYRDRGLAFCRTWRFTSRIHPGDPLPTTYLGEELRRLCLEAGVRPLHPHALRHTSATLSLLSGIPPKVVSERLGHANIGITLDLYARVLPEQDADAAEKLGSVLAD